MTFCYSRYTDYSADGKPVTRDVPVDQTEATINSLTPFTEYDFFIKRNTDSTFPLTSSVNAKTLEAGNHFSPIHFHLINLLLCFTCSVAILVDKIARSAFFVNSALKIQCHVVHSYRVLFRRFCPLG